MILNQKEVSNPYTCPSVKDPTRILEVKMKSQSYMTLHTLVKAIVKAALFINSNREGKKEVTIGSSKKNLFTANTPTHCSTLSLPCTSIQFTCIVQFELDLQSKLCFIQNRYRNKR